MNSSKRTREAAPAAAALKLLRGLLDQKRRVREPDGSQRSIPVREIILRQVLKGAAEQKGASGAAFKFFTRYPADYAQALARWQSACKRTTRASGIADLAMGGVLRIPFPCDIGKVMAHADTLDGEAQVEFLLELRRQSREGEIPMEFLSQAWVLRDKS